MIQLTSGDKTYHFCSTCRKKMLTTYDDGDACNMSCPDLHESFLTYKTSAGLLHYAAKLFAPKVGMGAKES